VLDSGYCSRGGSARASARPRAGYPPRQSPGPSAAGVCAPADRLPSSTIERLNTRSELHGHPLAACTRSAWEPARATSRHERAVNRSRRKPLQSHDMACSITL